MKMYADLPGRRAGQLLGDLFLVGWVLGWGYAGRLVEGAVRSLRRPADQLRASGGSLTESMSDAGRAFEELPLVGDSLRAPFDQAAEAGRTMARLGADAGAAVDRWALVLGLVAALVPIVLGILVWALVRGRFVRRASAAARFVDDAADVDLFALRALSRQPTSRLARISADPAGEWRRGNPDVVWALAELELRDSGLRPPARRAVTGEPG